MRFFHKVGWVFAIILIFVQFLGLNLFQLNKEIENFYVKRFVDTEGWINFADYNYFKRSYQIIESQYSGILSDAKLDKHWVMSSSHDKPVVITVGYSGGFGSIIRFTFTDDGEVEVYATK